MVTELHRTLTSNEARVAYRLPSVFVILHLRGFKNCSIVPTDSEVVVIMLAQLYHQIVVLQLELL